MVQKIFQTWQNFKVFLSVDLFKIFSQGEETDMSPPSLLLKIFFNFMIFFCYEH